MSNINYSKIMFKKNDSSPYLYLYQNLQNSNWSSIFFLSKEELVELRRQIDEILDQDMGELPKEENEQRSKDS